MNNPSGANQYRKLVDEVEPAGVQGGEDKRANCEFNQKKRKPGKSNADPERIIARLKRDKADEAQPEEVHGGVNQVDNINLINTDKEPDRAPKKKRKGGKRARKLRPRIN